MWAQEVEITDIEENFPTRVEDERMSKGIQVEESTRYTRTYDGLSRYTFEPRVQFGFTDATRLEVASRLFAGPDDRSDSGDVDLRLYHRFHNESKYWPGLSLGFLAELPTGVRSAGLDTRVRLVLAKTLTESDRENRLYVNAAWWHNADRYPDQRRNYYEAILGYSRRIRQRNVIVLDYSREPDRRLGIVWNLAEVGLRRQLNKRAVLSYGIGAGVGQQSPKIRAMLGFEFAAR